MPTAAIRGSTIQPKTFLSWIGSLFGLAGLVLGIPTALVAFHVTPPLTQLGHLITSPDAALHYLNGSLSDSAVAKSVACAAWVAWLWLVICVGVEIVAAIRGRPALRLPASRHVQSFATALVGASLAIVPLGKDGLPMRLYVPPAAIHKAATVSELDARTNHGNGTQDRCKPIPTETVKRAGPVAIDDARSTVMSGTAYVVKPGDTLWSIAQNELGSPLRWPEIAELNYGRVQSDGGRLTDAHWIYPGWELLIPSTPDVSSSSVVVERLPIPAAGLRPSTADSPSLSASRRSGPLARGSYEERDRGDPAGDRNFKPSDSELTGSDRGQHPSLPVPAGAIGYGILGAGVIALLERMRRVQSRHRRSGLRIALPDDDLVALERRLRIDSDPEGADIIDLGLRALVVYSLRCEMTPPPAALVRLGDHALEILLDPGAISRVPPQPFTSDGRQMSWSLSREHATIQALRDDSEVVQMDAPFPALVTVGRDEFGLALIDLEQAASVDVTGTNAEGILGTIAVEMATARWADQVELILVGFDRTLDALERVNHFPTIADVVPKVARRVRERIALLASVGRRANWEIRWAEGGDSWDLCVVICAEGAVDADRDGAGALVGLAGSGGQGLAVVLGADTGAARWHLDAGDGRVALRANDSATSAFSSQPPDPQFAAGVASLVQVASQLDGVRPTDPPYDKLEEGRAHRDGGSLTDPPLSLEDIPEVPEVPEVQVRVLGPIEILGATRPFTRAWAIELIVYLAMHPNGASSEQWATALWPDRVMAAASLHSTASAARRSLGVSISGDDHLPRAHGRLSLGPSVGSDWTQFEELSEGADPESWRLALELIRGRPFEGLRAPDWVLLEGIAANVEAVVVDLASRHAEYCLSVADASGAEWSARQGLRVSAYDERLYRILLRAADAAGNPAGVESVMAELVRLVADDVEPYDAVHPETLELYRSLSRRPAPSLNR